jgi:hypothetical protein
MHEMLCFFVFVGCLAFYYLHTIIILKDEKSLGS